MTREQVAAMFPRASRSTIEANGGFTFQPEIVSPKAVAEVNLARRRGSRINKTEAEYARILEAQKQRGEIIHYVYEGIRLKWGDSMHYLADFAVFIEDKPIKLIEVKNAFIWDRDRVRFLGCRAEWRKYFDFELWQKKAGEWKLLY